MTNTALIPVADLEKMALAVAASKLFGMQTPEQAMALMLVAQAEGLHPATAARDYHIIQGRPALKADAMLARYLNSGGKVEWHEHTDMQVSATFSHPAGGTLKIEWDMKRAKQAGLGTKDNWTKYPRQMLRARVISEGVRATNPAVAVGLYTPEEVQDFAPAKQTKAQVREAAQAVAKAKVDKDNVIDVGVTEEIPDAAPQVGPKTHVEGTGATHPPSAAAASAITADQHIAIMDALRDLPNGEARLKKASKVERLSMIARKDYERTLEWIERAKEVPAQG